MKPTRHVFRAESRTLLCNFGEAMRCLWHSLTLALTRKDEASSTMQTDIFWALAKQVHRRDPRGKIVSDQPIIAFSPHEKPCGLDQREVVEKSRKRVIWHTVMVQKNYRGALCGQSGEKRPQCWHPSRYTPPDDASTVICVQVSWDHKSTCLYCNQSAIEK